MRTPSLEAVLSVIESTVFERMTDLANGIPSLLQAIDDQAAVVILTISYSGEQSLNVILRRVQSMVNQANTGPALDVALVVYLRHLNDNGIAIDGLVPDVAPNLRWSQAFVQWLRSATGVISAGASITVNTSLSATAAVGSPKSGETGFVPSQNPNVASTFNSRGLSRGEYGFARTRKWWEEVYVDTAENTGAHPEPPAFALNESKQ
jgi:hypothetical protein